MAPSAFNEQGYYILCPIFFTHLKLSTGVFPDGTFTITRNLRAFLYKYIWNRILHAHCCLHIKILKTI